MFTGPERLALAGYTGLTREAYALDLRQFAAWCRQHDIRLFGARRADIGNRKPANTEDLPDDVTETSLPPRCDRPTQHCPSGGCARRSTPAGLQLGLSRRLAV